MYKELNFKLRGVAPMLMHNGKLSDPLNGIARKMKVITSKRAKTEADHEMLYRVEFLGSLYTTEELDFDVAGDKILLVKGKDGGQICIPADNIEGMLIQAAKRSKKGTEYKAGIMVDGPSLLQYNGPKTPMELLAKNGFRDTRRCKVQSSAIMRTRAIFRSWSLEVTVKYLSDLIKSEADLIETMVMCGKIIGLGDYRPKYGRFEVEQV